MNTADALEFCSEWLPAWSGNQPNELIKFYDEDIFYVDPLKKDGIHGRDQLLTYFKKLLTANPEWRWEPIEVMSIEKGFILKWKATIPLGPEELIEQGLDIVEVTNGLITRNEIYFDRSILLTIMFEKRLEQMALEDQLSQEHLV